jgi:hypothetical protein
LIVEESAKELQEFRQFQLLACCGKIPFEAYIASETLEKE